jgi:hypothetical protein
MVLKNHNPQGTCQRRIIFPTSGKRNLSGVFEKGNSPQRSPHFILKRMECLKGKTWVSNHKRLKNLKFSDQRVKKFFERKS